MKKSNLYAVYAANFGVRNEAHGMSESAQVWTQVATSQQCVPYVVLWKVDSWRKIIKKKRMPSIRRVAQVEQWCENVDKMSISFAIGGENKCFKQIQMIWGNLETKLFYNQNFVFYLTIYKRITKFYNLDLTFWSWLVYISAVNVCIWWKNCLYPNMLIMTRCQTSMAKKLW